MNTSKQRRYNIPSKPFHCSAMSSTISFLTACEPVLWAGWRTIIVYKTVVEEDGFWRLRGEDLIRLEKTQGRTWPLITPQAIHLQQQSRSSQKMLISKIVISWEPLYAQFLNTSLKSRGSKNRPDGAVASRPNRCHQTYPCHMYKKPPRVSVQRRYGQIP